MARFWTKERCAIEAAKYATRSEFTLGCRGAYRASLENGWLKEIGAHLKFDRTPSRLISREACAEEALKYSSRVEFQREGKRFYVAARRRGWLDEICVHMAYLRNTSAELTLERCAEEARKYQTRTDFAKSSTGYYIRARRMGWLDDVCSHMDVVRETWTKEMCEAEAAKHGDRSNFYRTSPKAYGAAARHGWLDEVTAHMGFRRKPDGYWTKEKCFEVAKKHSVRKEFQNQDKGCYIYCLRQGWLDEICSHMERQGSRFERYVYLIISREVPRAYVGLTFNKEVRINQHRLRGRPAVKSLLSGPHKIFWSLLLARDDAAILEDDLIHRLRDRGYEVVNATRGGNLGGSTLIWTFDACLAEAQRYQSRSAFERGSKGAYTSARKNGWFAEVCAHMAQLKKPNWSKERCSEEAKKYQTRAEFERSSLSAYSSSLRNGWIDEICAHMRPLRTNWTKEKCAEAALKYPSRTLFSKRDRGAYQAAWKNGWLDEICAHMTMWPRSP